MIAMLTVDEIENTEQAQTQKETDRKCPSCGGTMDYSPETGGLACPYCGYTEEIALDESESSAAELDFESAENTENCDWGVKKKTVICKSCGAESVYDALQISDVCPYCGSNQVTEVSDVNTMAPGGVVGFQISSKQAGEKFKNWIKKKWFCPKIAKESAKPDAFKGVYLPYWTFDTDTDTEYTARYGIDRTQYYKDKDGNQQSKIVTDWYNTSGEYEDSIDDELVCGTDRYERELLARIEPFDTEANKAYKPEYLSGFISERYSIGLKESWEKAKKQIQAHIKSGINSKICSEHNADRVSDIKMQTSFYDITYKYLLLPVWMSSFTYKGKIYRFFVNGQTGKVGGKAPVSPFKVTIAVLIGLAILAFLFYVYQNA